MGELEALVERAKAGDREALESVVAAVQDRVYSLARRMLWHSEDARDAAQEILVRVVTHLGSFRGESAFLTWVYRVAANHLMTARKGRLEEQALSWQAFGEDLARGLSDAPVSARSSAEEALLLEEVKVGCTLAMLACLDRPHRLAYVVGEILEMDHAEAAAVLGIAAAAFRKRLSRARGEVVAFTSRHCGLVQPANACRCRRRVARATETGRVNPERLEFAADPERARQFPRVLAQIRRLEETRRAAALYRSHPDFAAPGDLAAMVRRLIARADPA